ncbi:luciferase family protein [Streptomyces sporangiiformans]|uniref:luciferase domain-containing protein n=1 Tax=Streptomyces sporangiiformans TaxID=2315329 RepID=UPI0013C4A24C|nr:luciferase family protein [Streptomyces sporangiiformans]
MNAAHRAMALLESWPNLVSGPPKCAVGHAFASSGHEIVHFHSDDSADLYLTRTAIERLLPQLLHSSAIRVRPGAAWITVLLDCDADVQLLLGLVSVALKEHGAVQPRRTSPPCDWERPPARPTVPRPRPGAARRVVDRLMPHGH